MAPRFRRLASAAVLQLAALVLAHQLVYLARYGSRFGEALAHSGHGEAWSASVVTSLLLGAALTAVGLARLHRLGILARRFGESKDRFQTPVERTALTRSFIRLAPRIAVLQLVLLSAQENLEHVAIGLVAPGPAVLFLPEYAGGAWIALGVSLAVSLVATVYAGRRAVLQARLRAARAAHARGCRSAASRPGITVRPPVESVLGRRSALRAPPQPGGAS